MQAVHLMGSVCAAKRAGALLDKNRNPDADYMERLCFDPVGRCIAWVTDINYDGKDDVLLVSYQNPADYPMLTLYSGGEDWKRVSTIHGSVRAEN